MRSSHIPSITHFSRRRPKQIQARTKYIPRIPRYVTRNPKNSKLTVVPAMSFAPPKVSPVYRAPRTSLTKTSQNASPQALSEKAGPSKRLTTSVTPFDVAPVYLESYHSLPRPAKEPGPYENYFYELPIPRKEEEVEEDEEEAKEKEERKLTNEALVDAASLKNLLTISTDFLQFLLASLGHWQSEAGAEKTKKERKDILETGMRLTGILILGSLAILLQLE